MAEQNAVRNLIFVTIAIIFGSLSIFVRAGDSDDFLTDADYGDYDDIKILNLPEANFSAFNETAKYMSTTMNDPKGMAPLYKISNQILDLFLGNEPIAPGKCALMTSFRR